MKLFVVLFLFITSAVSQEGTNGSTDQSKAIGTRPANVSARNATAGNTTATEPSAKDVGFVDPDAENKVTAVIKLAGVDKAGMGPHVVTFRKALGEVTGLPVDSIAVVKMSNAPMESQLRRRRLLSSADMKAVSITAAIASPTMDVATRAVAALKKLGDDKELGKSLVEQLRSGGATAIAGMMLVSASIAAPKVSSGSSGASGQSGPSVGQTGAIVEKPVPATAFGMDYTWEVIGDVEIDAAAKHAAEWCARAEYRILQEKKAVAAVVGTRAEVREEAAQAHAGVGDALEAAAEPGDAVINKLTKSEEHTQTAKEKRRQLKVLIEYRRKVSAKRKLATTTRDDAIAVLLRHKVIRINTAKQLWMTLANKVVDLNEMLQARLATAHVDAEVAHAAELKREPQQIVLSKLQASQRAQESARHTKEYLNALIYKTKCAEKLLHDWECKVKINCTAADAGPAAPERPAWSTPALDALAQKMTEADGEYKEAKEGVPKLELEPSPKPPSAAERKLAKLEKKYSPPPCMCKLDGGRCGIFIKGGGGICQEMPSAAESAAATALDLSRAEQVKSTLAHAAEKGRDVIRKDESDPALEARLNKLQATLSGEHARVEKAQIP